ncbi:hypothetical protein VNO78_09776 [Psophocarpus tetragonolobus]|uniref:Embryo defective 1273 n=1 Tax=Psophocarpus tetragonolobus TaxID=3891 RepID=A0AAN9SZQ1_PSOTE
MKSLSQVFSPRPLPSSTLYSYSALLSELVPLQNPLVELQFPFQRVFEFGFKLLSFFFLNMSLPFHSHLLSATASSRFHPLTLNNTFTIEPPFPFQAFKGTSCFVEKHSYCLSVKPFCAYLKRGSKISCSMNMSAQQSDDHGKMKLDQLIDKVQKLWDSSPEPVKKFPWNKALDNFIQLILDLILAVVKYLAVPVFAVTSLSEMSYCAHESKLVLVPIPVLFGFAVAGILKGTALELSPRLKDAEVPWHLIAIAIFFTLIKLPGPYYPYWGRIIIPHFANGVLLRTLWFAILWYRKT